MDSGRGPRAAGIVLTILGMGGVGVGAAFTVLAKNKLADSNTAGCVGNTCPVGPAFDARSEAYRDGNIATGAWIGGGVVAATGVGLLIAATVIKGKPGASAPAPAVAIVPGQGASLGLSGRF